MPTLELSYTGTDIIGEDDLSQSPWTAINGGAVTTNAAVGPTGLTDAARIYAATTGSFRSVAADEVAFASGVHVAYIWVRAGTVTTCTLAFIDSTYATASAVVQYGPGAVVVSGARANVSGLSTEEWSLIRITSTSLAAGNHDISIFPNQAGAVTAGDDVYVWKPRCSAGDGSSTGWTITVVPDGSLMQSLGMAPALTGLLNPPLVSDLSFPLTA